MAEAQQWQALPTQLERAEFEQFVLPHLSIGSRGPAPKLSLYKIFNYVLKILYLGCQWKELPIHKDGEGQPETHYTRIYRIWRRWVDDGCMDAIFAGSVSRLHEDGRLDMAVIHGDGTTTAAKKGGDNLGFNGHKRVKGDKVVAFCDRRSNVIAPFVVAPGNRNEAPLLGEALPEVMRIVREVGMDLGGTIVSLDGVYDCRANRKAIFNRGMVPNINPNPRRQKAAEARPQADLRAGHLQRALLDNRAGVCLGGQVPAATAALRAHQRAALRIQDPRLHDDQSPALLPDLILDRWRPLVEFQSGAARRDPACPGHTKKPPKAAQIITICSESGSASASFLYHYSNPRRLPSKPATSCVPEGGFVRSYGAFGEEQASSSRHQRQRSVRCPSRTI
jgi:hypothetical protein